MTIRHVLFDMDGVLVDSRVPITTCMKHSLAGHGLVAPSDDELRGYIGPPLHDAFVAILECSGASERVRSWRRRAPTRSSRPQRRWRRG